MWAKNFQDKPECLLKGEKLVFGQEIILFYQLVVKNVVDESQQQVDLSDYDPQHLLCLQVNIHTQETLEEHQYSG